MAQITYQDKVALNENPSIEDINKVNAGDMNEIKSVVNGLLVNNKTTGTYNGYDCDYINDLMQVLWTNPTSPTTAFAGQSITLSESISNFTYYEVIYKFTISEYGIATQSTGKVPVNELARLIDVSGGVPNFRNVTALSGTSMTFADCKYYTAYLATTTNNYNSSCVPIQVLGYK